MGGRVRVTQHNAWLQAVVLSYSSSHEQAPSPERQPGRPFNGGDSPVGAYGQRAVEGRGEAPSSSPRVRQGPFSALPERKVNSTTQLLCGDFVCLFV